MIDETDPAVALQAAMFAACTNSAALQAIAGGVRVFDRVSVSVFPFVRIGEDLVSPDDSACGSVSEVFSTVRAYSRRPGLVEVKQIAAVLQDLLDMRTGDLDVDGFRLVVGNCEGVSFERHADGLTTQAIVNFRYRLAPVATSRDYAAAGELGELVGAASAAVKIKATASATLGELVGAASAVVPIKATAAGTLGELTGAASAAVKIKATASATLGDLVGAALASITTPATAAAPSVVWAAFTSGSGTYDMSGQDIEEGDVILMVTIGPYINTATYGNHSVQYDGWTLIYTNGSSSNATTLSYRIVDAAYLLVLDGARSGNGAATQMNWCVRGADLAQFAATDMGGYLKIADATVSTYGNTGTNIDTATGTVDVADSLILSLGVTKLGYLAKTAPAGYTIDAQGTAGGKSGHIASKAGPAVGTENPGTWSGGNTGTFRGYTLVIAPL